MTENQKVVIRALAHEVRILDARLAATEDEVKDHKRMVDICMVQEKYIGYLEEMAINNHVDRKYLDNKRKEIEAEVKRDD